MIKPPLAIVNFKAYNTAVGENAVNLAQICERVAEEFSVSIGVAVQPVDIKKVSETVNIPVFSQHIDAIDYGSHTGWIHVDTIKYAGAAGSLINHSEHRLKLSDIDYNIAELRKRGLMSVVCTNNQATSCAVATLNPDMLAVEPPELIGTGISVSTAKPEVVSGTVSLVRDINKDVVILCGAGVSSEEDVRKAIELGSQGVLLASYITKAKEPYEAMASIAQGLINK